MGLSIGEETYRRVNDQARRISGCTTPQPGFGWPKLPQLETLRHPWLAASRADERRRITDDIRTQAFQDMAFLPAGKLFQPIAPARNAVGGLEGIPLFWGSRWV